MTATPNQASRRWLGVASCRWQGDRRPSPDPGALPGATACGRPPRPGVVPASGGIREGLGARPGALVPPGRSRALRDTVRGLSPLDPPKPAPTRPLLCRRSAAATRRARCAICAIWRAHRGSVAWESTPPHKNRVRCTRYGTYGTWGFSPPLACEAFPPRKLSSYGTAYGTRYGTPGFHIWHAAARSAQGWPCAICGVPDDGYSISEIPVK